MHRPLISLRIALWFGLASAGCTGVLANSDSLPGDAGAGVDPSRASLVVDTSSTSPYVPLDQANWPLRGTVSASHGVSAVAVNDAPAALDGRSFAQDVSIEPGLHLVRITARDGQQPAYLRDAHRSVLRADFLPEGALLAEGGSIVLTEPLIAAAAAPHAEAAAALDMRPQILARDPLIDEDGCVIHPDEASHQPAQIRMFVDNGALKLETRVNRLRIDFSGRCRRAIITVGVHGYVVADIVMTTTLSAPPTGDCVTGLAHTTPEVRVENLDMDVDGNGFLNNLLVNLFGGDQSEQTEDSLITSVREQGDAMLTQQLQNAQLINVSESVAFAGSSLQVSFCLTGLETVGPDVVALVGSRATGTAPVHEGPGAPLVPGARALAPRGQLYLNASALDQVMFSAWRDGALDRPEATTIDVALLGVLVRGLSQRLESQDPVKVAMTGGMMPYVRAAPAGGEADLLVEMGDVELVFRSNTQHIMTLGAHLNFELKLVPGADGIRPEVVRSSGTFWVRDEPLLELTDELITSTIASQVQTLAQQFFADIVVPLPTMPGLSAPTDVTPVEGGRYLALTM